MTGIEEQMQVLQTKFAFYNHDNVYNMNKTELFYNLASDITIANRQIEGLIHY